MHSYCFLAVLADPNLFLLFYKFVLQQRNHSEFTKMRAHIHAHAHINIYTCKYKLSHKCTSALMHSHPRTNTTVHCTISLLRPYFQGEMH